MRRSSLTDPYPGESGDALRAAPAPGQLSLWAQAAPRRSAAEAIRDARKSRGWGQRRLATGIGVNQSTISRLESGELEPTLEDIVSIGHVLNVPLASLLGSTANRSLRRAIRPESRPVESRWLARQVPAARYVDYARAGGSLAALRGARQGAMPLTAGDAALLLQLGLVAAWPEIAPS